MGSTSRCWIAKTKTVLELDCKKVSKNNQFTYSFHILAISSWPNVGPAPPPAGTDRSSLFFNENWGPTLNLPLCATLLETPPPTVTAPSCPSCTGSGMIPSQINLVSQVSAKYSCHPPHQIWNDFIPIKSCLPSFRRAVSSSFSSRVGDPV